MAQSIIGTDLANAWAAASARVAVRVTADWGVVDSWTDVTEYVLSIGINRALYDTLSGLPMLGSAGPETASVVLNNSSRYFSVNNAAGIIDTYANLANGIYRIPIRIDLGYYSGATPEYLRQFTGQIETAVEHEATGNMVTLALACTGNAVALMQYKLSSAVAENQRPDEYMATLLDEASVTGYDLDHALTEIPWSWVDDENVWDECRQLAAGDGGWFYFGKSGEARFRRLTSLLERADSTTPVAVLTSGNALSYQDSVSWRDCYTSVIAEWAGRYIGTLSELFLAPRPIEVPPGETITEEVRFRYPAYLAIAPVYDTDYRAVTSAPATVAYGAAGVQLSMTAYAQRAELEITNNLEHETLYITDLVVRGYPLLGEEAQQKRYESSLELIPGDKAYPMRGNPYVQTQEQVERTAGFLRDWLQRPRRIYSWTGPACPWLEPLDRVTLSHNVMTPNPGTDVDCYVLNIGMTYSSGNLWRQDLLLLPCENLYAYDDYFIIGESAYADTDSNKVAY